MMTRIELENGVHRKPGQSTHRRALLDRLLRTLPVVMFNDADIRSYQAIVAELGFDRRLTIDRLIAAQALTRDATLITHNGKDFRKISGLRLVEWGTPAA
jgi:tRNA(fMet)-specific endonuclease VapC